MRRRQASRVHATEPNGMANDDGVTKKCASTGRQRIVDDETDDPSLGVSQFRDLKYLDGKVQPSAMPGT